ncbi:uncharacterized protein OGAPODRAFT_16212, partial [Ogataea polymorpha]|uniref:uncharacterized protein n=1 Tax=Ogataea polymorpha TaxID=460523 RepID=UPI0007F4A574
MRNIIANDSDTVLLQTLEIVSFCKTAEIGTYVWFALGAYLQNTAPTATVTIKVHTTVHLN